ncbi:hypothetical protein BKA83DRAFT_4493676 [Pisolithus microcarpus]|nr:hypothetical protein BKA83DRAFT_4493676 [Pisolithus microcarpus]
MPQYWVVFGGDETGIYHTCPYIPCGRLTPPLPLAIECTSADEARVVMQTLHTVLDPILPEPSTHELVHIICTSPAIQNLLNDADQDGFYAVVIGNPPGIHWTEEGAIQAAVSFSWLKWKQTDTLCNALAYMVMKGIKAQLPPVIIQVPANPHEPDVDELNDLFQNVVHMEPPPGPGTTCMATAIPGTARPSVPSQPQGHPVHAQPPRGCDANSIQQTNLPRHTSQIIYTHIQTLRGIMESHYGYSMNTAVDTYSQVLSSPAALYLAAHGYTHEAIEHIIHMRGSTLSGHDFTLHLSQHGLAIMEGVYLWQLIQSQ